MRAMTIGQVLGIKFGVGRQEARAEPGPPPETAEQIETSDTFVFLAAKDTTEATIFGSGSADTVREGRGGDRDWGGGSWSPPEGGWTPPEGGWSPPDGGWTPPDGGWSPPDGGWQPPDTGGGGIDLDWLLPVEVTIEVDGVLRSFGITMPKDFDPGQLYAGIMTFHGGGETANDPITMAGLADWSDYENPPEFIEIYPIGLGDTWGWDPNEDPFNDLAFVEALVDELIANWNLDPEALFAAGISAGGSMVQRLALEVPELFAGYGVVVSSLTEAMTANAVASDVDEPMIIFHGTEDAFVPYEGYYTWQGDPILYSGEEMAEFWAEWNESEMGEFAMLPDTADDGMEVMMRTSLDGSIAHYVVVGGDHSWPGSLETSAQDIDASQLIVEFFADYGL